MSARWPPVLFVSRGGHSPPAPGRLSKSVTTTLADPELGSSASSKLSGQLF